MKTHENFKNSKPLGPLETLRFWNGVQWGQTYCVGSPRFPTGAENIGGGGRVLKI